MRFALFDVIVCSADTATAAVDELRDNVLASILFADVVNGQDVRVIEGRSRLGFPLKSASRGRVCGVLVEKLDRHRAIQLRIEGAVHDTHAAFAQDAVDPIGVHSCAAALVSAAEFYLQLERFGAAQILENKLRD